MRLSRASYTISVLVLFAMLPWTASGAERTLELEDYFRVESIDSPTISPDGRWVAFVRSYILKEANQRQSEIWLVPADGSAPPTRITQPSSSSSNPIWSPDGKLLAFRSRRDVPGKEDDEVSSIWFLRMEGPGGEAFQIEGVGGMPLFSPDNKWVAFTRETPPKEKREGDDGSELEQEIHERFQGRIYDWMNFRFDRRGYLPDPRDPEASPPEELYIVPRSGGEPRKLTSLGVDVETAVWSPDSSALAVVADSQQRDEYTYEKADLWMVTLDGEIERLTDDGYNHSTPSWSPDGRYLVFRREEGLDLVIEAKQGHGAPVDLYRMPASGGEMESLTADWDLRPGAPKWSPDGRFVYFTAEIGGDVHLFRVPALGGGVEQLTRGGRRLGDFDFTPGLETMVFTVTDPVHPAEIFMASIDATVEKKLTGFHDALIEDVTLRPAERILFPSKDGTEIEGWIILPPGYDPAGQPYPMILAMHGGPHGAYGNDFSFQFQLWAARGYVVLYTNPRGSTGYGEKFLYATWGGWGILDYEDVMAGVDHALQNYRIDEKRLGVTGYSYGGFLTDWVIGHTTRFAAAVSGAGISNWISDYGTADIPRTKESEFFGPPWKPESGALLWKLSPVQYAGNVTTPTLFIHGESDFRVPIEQGEQMYTALKKRRIPAKFIRYPDSYHGGWTPWNMVHRYYHELEWWKTYLSSPGT